MIAKLSIICILSFPSAVALATQTCPNGNCPSQKTLTLNELRSAYENLNEQIAHCRETRRNNALEENVIPTEGLTREQILLVIFYRSLRAEHQCAAEAKGQLAMALSRVEVFDYADDLNSNNRELYEQSKSAIQGVKSYYDLQLQYIEKLPESYRERIEDLDALNRPFSASRTADEYNVSGPPRDSPSQ